MARDEAKRAAAERAASYVADGMRVGLGTGTTVAFLLPALARRRLSLRCVATSPRTAEAAVSLGLRVEEFTREGDLSELDVAIDGADQVDAEGWLVKGGGGAHTREKVVARAARRFVVIVSDDKLVRRVAPPVPLELLAFGLSSTLRLLDEAVVRETPPSPDGGILADLGGTCLAAGPRRLAERLSSLPGVVEHGLFPPELVDEVVVGREDGTTETLALGRGRGPHRA